MEDLDALRKELEELKDCNILRVPGINQSISTPDNQEMLLSKLIVILEGIRKHHGEKRVKFNITFVR
jgi:uridine kinase